MLSEPPFSMQETFRAVDDAIDSNADLADAILQVGLPALGVDPNDDSWKGKATPNDMDKARSTLKQFYRDWSAEGAPERHATHKPIFEALEKHLHDHSFSQRYRYRILVPGVGLGRLVFDLCMAGYTVEGNEISYHQLFASNYILNYTRRAKQHTIYPWALGFSNHTTRANQLRPVAVPDVQPGLELEKQKQRLGQEVHGGERMSMTAGDFCSLYKQPEYAGAFHAVTTCFFIDTAPNVIRYIETVRHCLRAGGIWVNIGPLLWHFESSLTPAEGGKSKNGTSSNQQASSGENTEDGIGEPGSFELSNDEVLALLTRLGFETVEQSQAPAGATGYIQDPESMLQNVYRPAFWVARKVQHA